MLLDKKVCFIGAGAMAEAILSGIFKHLVLKPEAVSVINRANELRLNQLAGDFGISAEPDQKYRYVEKADILILVMKPKDMRSSLEEIRAYTKKEQLIISVAAGVKSDTISELLGHDAPVIRTMPNTSAQIGESVTGLCGGKMAQEEHIQLAMKIFESIGSVFRVDENDMDAVTAVSGSGPAFIYYFVEAMLSGAQKVGLDEGLGKELILQTMTGAANMLLYSGKEPSVLREQICSPGGTTLAGLDVLQSYGFREAVQSCIDAATRRAVELGKLHS